MLLKNNFTIRMVHLNLMRWIEKLPDATICVLWQTGVGIIFRCSLLNYSILTIQWEGLSTMVRLFNCTLGNHSSSHGDSFTIYRGNSFTIYRRWHTLTFHTLVGPSWIHTFLYTSKYTCINNAKTLNACSHSQDTI